MSLSRRPLTAQQQRVLEILVRYPAGADCATLSGALNLLTPGMSGADSQRAQRSVLNSLEGLRWRGLVQGPDGAGRFSRFPG